MKNKDIDKSPGTYHKTDNFWNVCINYISPYTFNLGKIKCLFWFDNSSHATLEIVTHQTKLIISSIYSYILKE